MKNRNLLIAFICGLLISSLFAFSSSRISSKQSDDKALAKVNEIDGKYVFINCTPVQPYETAFDYSTVAHGFGCPSIDDMANASVASAKKKGLPFDAIIVGNTKTDLAIRFK